jgi:uncharacterized protein
MTAAGQAPETKPRPDSLLDRLLVVLATALFAVGTSLVVTPLQAAVTSTVVFGGLLTLSFAAGAPLVRPVAATGLLLGLFVAVAPAGTWPLPALAAVVVVTATAPGQRRRWLRRGHPDLVASALTVATVLVAPGALTIWYVTIGDASGTVREAVDLLREVPTWTLPLIAVGFATVNAFAEEAIYRGIIQTALTRAVGALPAVVLQAVAFGLAHTHGFPSGAAGVVLATAYGVALGVIRWRTDGLLAVWATHVVADLVIFALIGLTLL